MDGPSWTYSDSVCFMPPEQALELLRKVAKSRDFCTLCGVVTESTKSVRMNHIHRAAHSGQIGYQIDLDESYVLSYHLGCYPQWDRIWTSSSKWTIFSGRVPVVQRQV